MAFESIQIFACDHRKDVKWDLPYIRFGGPESECAIKINANKIFDIEVNADETPKLFWLWKNIKQLGNPDIIGYHQYRRFFSTLNTTLPVIDISEKQFDLKFILSPVQQLYLIASNNVDGILHPAFKVIPNSIQYKYIWEQIFILTKERMLPLKYQKLAFDILLKHTPDSLKDYMQKVFEVKENYLCNIFTAKKQIFLDFGTVAFNSIKDLLCMIPDNEKQKLHPYWLAYIFERYTSCWYHTLEMSGRSRFLKIPLLTIDANKHIDDASKDISQNQDLNNNDENI